MTISVFTDIPNLRAIWSTKERSTIASSGGNVTAWDAYLGSGWSNNQLTPSGVGVQPVVVTNGYAAGIDSVRMVRTGATDAVLKTGSNTALTATTLFAVFKTNTVGGWFVSDGYDASGTGGIITSTGGGGQFGANFGASQYVAGSGVANTWTMLIATSDGTAANDAINVDGTENTTGSNGFEFLQGVTLGGSHDGGTAFYTTEFALYGIADSILNAGDRSDLLSVIQTYLAALIAINEPAAYSAFQREPGSIIYSLPVSGVLPSGHSAAGIDAEIIDQSGNVIVNKISVDNSPGATSWAGNIIVPATAERLKINAYYTNDPSIYVLGDNEFIIGDRFPWNGQSNIAQMFDANSGSTTAINGHVIYQGVSDGDLLPSGEAGVKWHLPNSGSSASRGANAFAALLSARTGWGVATINCGESGSGLYQDIPAKGHWAEIGSNDPVNNRQPYTNMTTDRGVVGDDVAGLIWIQHTADVGLTSATQYALSMKELIADWRADWANKSGRSSLPIFLCSNVSGVGTDATFQGINSAKQSVVDELDDCYFIDIGDLGTHDGIHLAGDDTVLAGQRLALAASQAIGYGGTYQGPYFTHLTKNSTTQTDLHVRHTSGTDFTPTSNIGNLRLFEKGSAVQLTISAAVRLDYKTVRLTHTATDMDVYATHGYGNENDATHLIDNSSDVVLAFRKNLYFDSTISSASGAGVGLSSKSLLSRQLLSR